ncbi:MAG: dynamin family protein [Propionibacteriaceae bacterium]|jgi:hypothetical protein|nr:dynamin family protein [Propionibacteriaceae bacterium]
MAEPPLDAALQRVRDGLEAVYVPLPLPSAQPAVDLAKRLTAQLDGYIMPRLESMGAPLLVVVGGSTGAGKSTLVNSLIRHPVSPSSVLRPTTRVPHLVHHPGDAGWFSGTRVLPDLKRVAKAGDQSRALLLVADDAVGEGLAILDAPDIDSVVAENRQLAQELLDAADLWLFVTTADRYADAVPWDHLRQAAGRNATVAVVLDRVTPKARKEVEGYLRAMMEDAKLGAVKLFTIPETDVDDEGLLPVPVVAEVLAWLKELAADAARRQAVIARTLAGAIRQLTRQAPAVARAMDDQHNALEDLRAEVVKAYQSAEDAVASQTADGSLLRGEVLASWQEFVGTGEFFRAVERGIGSLRDRVAGALRGSPKQADEVGAAIEHGLDFLIRERAEAAAARILELWGAHAAGKTLIAAADWPVGRGSGNLSATAAELVRLWQADILRVVSTEGQAKRARARFLALGVNGVGVALMIVAFSQTGGLVGAEVGVAGGTALLAQRVLEAVFGEDAVRKIAKQCRDDLLRRVHELMAAEQERYFALIDAQHVDQSRPTALRAAVADVNRAREDDRRLMAVVGGGSVDAGRQAKADAGQDGSPKTGASKAEPPNGATRSVPVEGPSQSGGAARGGESDGAGPSKGVGAASKPVAAEDVSSGGAARPLKAGGAR